MKRYDDYSTRHEVVAYVDVPREAKLWVVLCSDPPKILRRPDLVSTRMKEDEYRIAAILRAL